MQGPSGDQAGPGQGPHACPAGAQVRVVAVVQGGQGGEQARSQTLHRQHLDLLALLCLGAWGPERPMCGIMEHAGGGVNKLETRVQILELFQGVDLVLLIET